MVQLSCSKRPSLEWIFQTSFKINEKIKLDRGLKTFKNKYDLKHPNRPEQAPGTSEATRISDVTDKKTKKSYKAKEIFIEKADSEYHREISKLEPPKNQDKWKRNNEKREDRPKWEACYHLGLAETDRQVSLNFNCRKPLISRIRYEENDETLEHEYDVFECTEHFEMHDTVKNMKKQYSGTIVIVMEQEKNDLEHYLLNRFGKLQPVPVNDLKRMLHDTLNLVYFLHVQIGYQKINNRVVHRDIKFKNILVPEDYDNFNCDCQTIAFNNKSCCDRRHKPCHHGDCKKPLLMLTDFGFATYEKNSEGKSIMSTGLGTHGFVPPEIALRLEGEKRYEAPADLWSVGIMFYEMMIGHVGQNATPGVHPHIKNQMETVDGVKVFRKFDENTESQIRSGYGDSALDLLMKLLAWTPSARITSTAALKHDFLNSDLDFECEYLREKSVTVDEISAESSSKLSSKRKSSDTLEDIRKFQFVKYFEIKP